MALRILAVLLVSLAALQAQATGRLGGVVIDEADAAIPGAQVVCRNVDTGVTFETTTGPQGLFRFPDLSIGAWEVVVTQEGFQRLVRSNIGLLTGHTLDLRLQLKVGAVEQSIEVVGDIPLVQTASSEVQTTIDGRAMRELPLNGRNPLELLVLTAGADFTQVGTIVGQQDNIAVTVNGLRGTDNNFQLDGAGYNNAHFGSAPTLPNPDTLEEFTVQSSNFSARESRAGAVVQLSTRSGTNQWHGSVFHFLRNEDIDARNFFDAERATFKRNQFGGSFGGPISKDRTFFFGSYQGTLTRGSPSLKLLLVPSAAQRGGDFSALASRKIVDPGTGAPFPNDRIPQNRFDASTSRLIDSVPLPNQPNGTLRVGVDSDLDDHQALFKVDHRLSDNNSLTVRYFTDWNFFQRDTNSLPGVYADNEFRNRIVTLRDTHIFTPSFNAVFSLSYSQTKRDQLPISPFYSQDLTDNVPLGSADAIPELRVNIQNYVNFFSGGPLVYDPSTWQIRTQFSLNHGKHFLGFGSDTDFSREYAFDSSGGAGSWVFSPLRTRNDALTGSLGDSFASFLLGLPATFSQGASEPQRIAQGLYHFWLQDDWKVHPRFTLNLGVRWEPMLPPVDNQGPLTGLLPGVQSTVAPDAPLGLVFSGDVRDSVYPADWNNIAPRVGFAWDLTGSGRTIVRAGYGIFYRVAPLNLQRHAASTAAFRSLSIAIDAPPSFVDPYAGFPGGTPFPFTAPSEGDLRTYKFNRPVVTAALDADASASYTQSWNLTIERQMLSDTSVSIAYVGNHSIKILSGVEGNPAVYRAGATAGNTNARRIYQDLGAVTYYTPWQWANYHSMQFNVTKRTRQGVSILANYVFAKIIDNSSNGTQGGLGGQARNPFDWNLDKGRADFDVAHRGNIALMYDLPQLGSASGLTKALVNGWQLNTIVTARTGLPFTVRSGVNRSLVGPSLNTGDQVGDATRPSGVDPLDMWFNTSAFVANGLGTFGTSGRNILRGPDSWTVNFSAFKNFQIGERQRVQLRIEAFNFFNHANFGNPNSNIANVNYGNVLTAADPRVLQFGLKYEF